MDTDTLIHQLAAEAVPVRRLLRPWARTLAWFAISLPFIAAVIGVMGTGLHLMHGATDWQFLVEQLATLATAGTAAIAAFCSIVPGYDRRILLLPLAPLAIWLASLGEGCMRDWLHDGADGLA